MTGPLGAYILPGETDNRKSGIKHIVHQMAINSMESSKRKGRRFLVFNGMIGKEDLMHKVAFKQRPRGEEGA